MNQPRSLPRGVLALLATAILIACVAVGCSRQATEADAPGGRGKKPQVALIMKSLANEFFSTMAAGAERHQQAHADDYDLVINGIKDERDLSRQVALVEEMVARGVDAIVIAPADSKALAPALKRAADQGVAVINIDNKLDDTLLSEAGVRIPFVGPDNRAGARKVGDYVASQLTAGDDVAILEGIRTSFNGQQRLLGFEDAVRAAGLKIVSSQSAQWEMSIANRIASAILSEHPNVKAILACNDSMALGALAAVKSAGQAGEVLVVGFDNIGAVRQAIREGGILATADQHGDQLAVFGIERALQSIAERTTIADMETPVDLITAADLR